MSTRRATGSLVKIALPGAGAVADDAGEDVGEVALVEKAAGERDLAKRTAPLPQVVLGRLDTPVRQPLVRSEADRAALPTEVSAPGGWRGITALPRAYSKAGARFAS